MHNRLKTFKNTALGPMNTFGIDAKCDLLVEFDTADDLREIFGRHVVGPWYVLGGGSNIVFTEDFRGTMLHPAGKSITAVYDSGTKVGVRVEAGIEWDVFVEWCVDNGLWGAENLSGIPGSAGASPVQNIGAYGAEVKDIIESVEVYCPGTGSLSVLTGEDCGFGYRNSVFKREFKGKAIITAVNYILSREPAHKLGYGGLRAVVEASGGPTLRNIRRAVTDIRRAKLPDTSILGNAGSFFKNPVVPAEFAADLGLEYADMPVYPAPRQGYVKLAAGWLIERCGWKGKRMGNVGVHEHQALIIVNYGGATGKEVLDFSNLIRDDVREKFDVDLEPEVNFL